MLPLMLLITVVPGTRQTIKDITIALGCPPELDGEILLIKKKNHTWRN